MNEIEERWRDLSQIHQCELSGVGSPDLSMTISTVEHLRGWCARESVFRNVLTDGVSLHWFFPLPLAAPQFQRPLGLGYSTSEHSLPLQQRQEVGTADGSSAAPNSTVHPNSSCSLNLASCWHQNTKGLHVFLKVRLTRSAILNSELGRGDGFCIWRHVQSSLSLWAEQTKHPQSWSELHFHTEGCSWICFILQIDDCY